MESNAVAEQRQKQSLIADGYFFLSEEDAKRAVGEEKKIQYIEERIDYNKPETVLTIYNKVVKENIFKTPVGLKYLKELQEYLERNSEINKEDIIPIPVLVSYEIKKDKEKVAPEKKAEKTQNDKKQLLYFSIILNIALTIAVMVMFSIALRSDQPNIINYENVLTDKYAFWEQELTKREQEIREKERELNINNVEESGRDE